MLEKQTAVFKGKKCDDWNHVRATYVQYFNYNTVQMGYMLKWQQDGDIFCL